MQRPRILLILPLLSCALPLPAEWQGNSSLIHAFLLIISIGIVLLFYAQKKIKMREIQKGVRWYPTMGVLLILFSQVIKIEGFSVFNLQSLIFNFQSTLFDNPAGLACFVCCLIAIESGNKAGSKWRQWRHWTVLGLLTTIVILTHSRTGVLALLLIVGIKLWHYRRLRWGIGLAVLLSLFGLLQMKRDSTSGRCFILQNTWRMIRERPLTGWGWNGFDKNYMQFQAEYFRQHPEDTANAWLADDVRHPMNEFLLWWVRFGIAGPVALGIMLLGSLTPYPPLLLARGERLQRRKGGDKVTDEGWPIFNLSSLRFTLLTFALLSYPLHYAFVWLFICLAWLPTIIFISYYLSSFISYLLIAVGTFSLFLSARLMQAEEEAAHHAHHRALRIYRQLAPVCQRDPHFLYSYARELYVTGQFEEALEYADHCEDYWCRYDLTLLKGDIHRQLRLYDEAETTYRTASLMCPNRFAPLEGLLTVYQETGDTTAANLTARRILSKGVKVGSEAVAEIQNMARQYISKHNKQ